LQVNIKIKQKVIGWEDLGWIKVAQDGYNLKAVVKTVVNIQVPTMRGFLN
jgi:hypothetical protein